MRFQSPEGDNQEPLRRAAKVVLCFEQLTLLRCLVRGFFDVTGTAITITATAANSPEFIIGAKSVPAINAHDTAIARSTSLFCDFNAIRSHNLIILLSRNQLTKASIVFLQLVDCAIAHKDVRALVLERVFQTRKVATLHRFDHSERILRTTFFVQIAQKV